MKRILVGVSAVTLAAASVGVSLAQSPGRPAVQSLEVKQAQKKQVARKLNLPNVAALTKRLLRVDRKIVQQQLSKSRQVIGFWKTHTWLLAPRKEKCWEVPWQRSCTIARHSFRLHSTLSLTAERRLNRELPLPDDWATAVHVVQRAFPGTEGWLMSCSAAEGGHGRWVRFGGGSYYAGYEYTDAVGGWPQYRWSTFKGHYRHGLESLRSRGFEITMPAPEDVRAWLMPMGHAIAAGWARWSGNDGSHWSASWGNGC